MSAAKMWKLPQALSGGKKTGERKRQKKGSDQTMQAVKQQQLGMKQKFSVPH